MSDNQQQPMYPQVPGYPPYPGSVNHQNNNQPPINYPGYPTSSAPAPAAVAAVDTVAIVPVASVSGQVDGSVVVGEHLSGYVGTRYPPVNINSPDTWALLMRLRVELQDSFLRAAFSVNQVTRAQAYQRWAQCYERIMSLFYAVQANLDTLPNVDTVVSMYQTGFSMLNSALEAAITARCPISIGAAGGGAEVAKFFDALQRNIRSFQTLSYLKFMDNQKSTNGMTINSERIEDQIVYYVADNTPGVKGKKGCSRFFHYLCCCGKTPAIMRKVTTLSLHLYDCNQLYYQLDNMHEMVKRGAVVTVTEVANF